MNIDFPVPPASSPVSAYRQSNLDLQSNLLDRHSARDLLNEYGLRGIPFFFFTDFLGNNWFIEADSAKPSKVSFDFKGQLPAQPVRARRPFELEKVPLSFEDFDVQFNQVNTHLQKGDSYLTNLTFKTSIYTNYSLEEIYAFSRAKYKVLVPDNFVFFSPEPFIKIKNNQISAFPMKGTICASEKNAAKNLMADPKEMAEHATIVDLIRNDLNLVAHKVVVSKYRYLEKICTHQTDILQTSSCINGRLKPGLESRLGDVVCSLIPAGSISGAPKKRTLEIIQSIEEYARNFYTGVCGYFNGTELDSCVMIRFIEKEGDKLYFKSGGGITYMSDPKKEYQEYLDKIYVPIY